MNDSSSAWATAQERERHYYATRAASHEGQGQVYAEFHAPLWTSILDRLAELKFTDQGVYVDVGCGPNPIVAFIQSGRRIGVDPLMPFYLENFKFPEGFEAHQGTIEDLAPIQDAEADVIFSMNNIDHIQDLAAAAKTLRRKLKDSGHLVVSVNIVRNPLTRLTSKLFDVYRWVDPTHTYHFHSAEEVAANLAPYFELDRSEDIEALSEEMQARKKSRDKQATTLRGVVRGGLKFIKNDVILRERMYLLLFRPAAAE